MQNTKPGQLRVAHHFQVDIFLQKLSCIGVDADFFAHFVLFSYFILCIQLLCRSSSPLFVPAHFSGSRLGFVVATTACFQSYK